MSLPLLPVKEILLQDEKKIEKSYFLFLNLITIKLDNVRRTIHIAEAVCEVPLVYGVGNV